MQARPRQGVPPPGHKTTAQRAVAVPLPAARGQAQRASLANRTATNALLCRTELGPEPTSLPACLCTGGRLLDPQHATLRDGQRPPAAARLPAVAPLRGWLWLGTNACHAAPCTPQQPVPLRGWLWLGTACAMKPPLLDRKCLGSPPGFNAPLPPAHNGHGPLRGSARRAPCSSRACAPFVAAGAPALQCGSPPKPPRSTRSPALAAGPHALRKPNAQSCAKSHKLDPQPALAAGPHCRRASPRPKHSRQPPNGRPLSPSKASCIQWHTGYATQGEIPAPWLTCEPCLRSPALSVLGCGAFSR